MILEKALKLESEELDVDVKGGQEHLGFKRRLMVVKFPYTLYFQEDALEIVGEADNHKRCVNDCTQCEERNHLLIKAQSLPLLLHLLCFDQEALIVEGASPI